MKLILKKNTERGGILMMLLCVTTVAALTSLAGYFYLVASQSHNVNRSQDWNAAIPTAEAGVEEAMEHLNYNCVSNYMNGGRIAYNADNWLNTNYAAQAGITKRAQVFGSNASYSYDVVIWTNDILHPIIEAKGHAPTTARLGGQPVFAAVGVSGGASRTITRDIRVIADPIYVFSKALLTKGPLNMNGNNVTVDSFDPFMAPGGVYNANYRNANGNIATAQITDPLNVGNAKVYGTVSTPYGGSVTVANNGSVGSVDWQNSGTGGIEPGWSRDDLNVTIDSAQLPSGFNPVAAGLSGVSFTNIYTNYIAVTNPAVTTYPTGYNLVLTNTSDVTSSTYPTGIPLTGSVQTNTVLTTTVSYPSADTYIGSVTTNTTQVTSIIQPSTGSYLGSLSTAIISYSNEHVAPTIFISGTLIVSGSIKNPKYSYSQYRYTYFSITGYTYQRLVSYTYHRIDSYSGVNFSSPVTVTNVATYQYIFPAGDWKVDSITGNVLVPGNARVLVQSSVSLTGQSKIVINPGASLILYMAGETADFGGKGIANNNPDAHNFSYVGLPSNKNVKLSGNTSFTGTIYAPQAQLQLAGGGNNNMDFVGAAVIDSVLMNGHFNLHYPEDLARKDPISGYVVKAWQEN